MFHWLVAALALGVSIPTLSAEANDPATCSFPEAEADSSAVETLIRESREALAAGKPAQAERSLQRVFGATDDEVTKAWAWRMLVDLRIGDDDLDGLERLLEAGCITGDAQIHARAWLAYRQERYRDAVALLQPLAQPRHHTLPRWSIVHEDLGDAYGQLGQRADAQAQWRIALATDYDPGAHWDRAALERKLATELSGAGGAEPMLPLLRYEDMISILDLASVERTKAGVRYDKLVLLKHDENGTAFGVDTWEMDCNAPRSRVLAVHGFDADGETTRRVDEPGSWSSDLPGDPWKPTERELVCSVDPDIRPTPRNRTNLEMLRAYRTGEPIFEAAVSTASDVSGSSEDNGAPDQEQNRTVECIVQVDAFIARIASEGPVAGPTWQIRDWWDERSWDIDETRLERELREERDRANELARTNPSAADAMQGSCVREAIEKGAVPGL